MKKPFHKAVPSFFLFLAVLVLCSCADPQKQFDRGNFQGAVNTIERMKNPMPEAYLLKARCYISMGEDSKALEGITEYLLLDTTETSSNQNRQWAVSTFIDLNTSDRLALFVLTPSDGIPAQKALYCAYSNLGDYDSAHEMLNRLSLVLDYDQFIGLVLSAPVEPDYITGLFRSWLYSLSETETDVFLSSLNEFSHLAMSESAAKQLLNLTDEMMDIEYYTSDDIRYSVLLKIKGNALEELFDRVNARLYWKLALRYNPDDAELRTLVE